ncbi:unnamed protein product [Caenorhabditis auriculariae]|uniref:Uncharacterized protein n=1 Tax=Caenorhabditis auriculariae TaxID=2777116 RepID=A0A8S1HFI8_9PELO|nr:unnamed protein product [Caenorhabditis auriculariae]
MFLQLIGASLCNQSANNLTGQWSAENGTTPSTHSWVSSSQPGTSPLAESKTPRNTTKPKNGSDSFFPKNTTSKPTITRISTQKYVLHPEEVKKVREKYSKQSEANRRFWKICVGVVSFAVVVGLGQIIFLFRTNIRLSREKKNQREYFRRSAQTENNQRTVDDFENRFVPEFLPHQ